MNHFMENFPTLIDLKICVSLNPCLGSLYFRKHFQSPNPFACTIDQITQSLEQKMRWIERVLGDKLLQKVYDL